MYRSWAFRAEKYGEEVVAYVQLKPGTSADNEELMAYCKDRIAFHKIPRHFFVVDEYPTTASGKIQKDATRKLQREADAEIETA
jgi:fatty-acyl-CoA synthase